MSRGRFIFLSVEEVKLTHARVLEKYGGADGVRDENLLQSAVAAPRNVLAYGEPTVFELAAAYLRHIASNHPFVDGNKRAAWASCLMFLHLNGYRVKSRHKEAADIVEKVATGAIRSNEVVAEWLKKGAELRSQK